MLISDWLTQTMLISDWLTQAILTSDWLSGIWVPGDQTSFRVTDTAVYQDKLFLGMENCSVMLTADWLTQNNASLWLVVRLGCTTWMIWVMLPHWRPLLTLLRHWSPMMTTIFQDHVRWCCTTEHWQSTINQEPRWDCTVQYLFLIGWHKQYSQVFGCQVRLYNVEDNSLVGEIETRAGPIYHISMNDRLLVCLSGKYCLLIGW